MVVSDSSSHWTTMGLHPDILQYFSSLFGQSYGRNIKFAIYRIKMKWDRSNSRKDAAQNAFGWKNNEIV